jgi:hypothetical protein
MATNAHGQPEVSEMTNLPTNVSSQRRSSGAGTIARSSRRAPLETIIEQGTASQNYTEDTLATGEAPLKKPIVRRSKPGRRSTFGYPSLPDADRDPAAESNDQAEPTIIPHNTSDIYNIDIGDNWLQCIWDTNIVHVKLTYDNGQHVTMCETPHDPDQPDVKYVLSIGTDTPLGEDVIATINSNKELLDVARNQPGFI